jgi:hypothetical protein
MNDRLDSHQGGTARRLPTSLGTARSPFEARFRHPVFLDCLRASLTPCEAEAVATTPSFLMPASPVAAR